MPCGVCFYRLPVQVADRRPAPSGVRRAPTHSTRCPRTMQASALERRCLARLDWRVGPFFSSED